MSTMIERVARAICIATGMDPDREGNETEWRWQEFEKEARAAIEAMREPPLEYFDAAVESDIVANDWFRVIDAMLKESK